MSAGTVVELESQRRPLVVNEYSFQCIMLPLFCPWYAIKNSSFYINFLLSSFLCSHGNSLSPFVSEPASPLQAALGSHPYLLLVSAGNKLSFSNLSNIRPGIESY